MGNALTNGVHPAVLVIDHGDAGLGRTAAHLLLQSGLTPSPAGGRVDLLVLVCAGAEVERVRAIREAAETYPDASLLAIVCADTRYAALRRAMLAGATGIAYEGELERTLVPTAHALLVGQLAVPTVLSRQIAPKPLSHREKQILGLIVLGYTNREIADTLYLAESTVKTHLSSAFRKIDARSRSEAVARITDPESGYGTSILETTKRLTTGAAEVVSPLPR
jgi:two-component system NarL family response regulator